MPPKRRRGKGKCSPSQAPCVFHSEDKDFDNEPPERHVFSARPSDRISFIGMPGHGKTSVMKNYLCHGDYEKVFICHGAGSASREYELVDYTPVTFEEHGPDFYIEESKKINGGKMVLVLDDLNY